MDGCNGWKHKWVDEWIARCMDGLANGWTDD